MIVSPIFRPFGGEDVALLAVGVVQERERALRFGSYSIALTRAGISSLSRLKSMMR